MRAIDTITVWKDGSWNEWNEADACYAANDAEWLANIHPEAILLDFRRRAETAELRLIASEERIAQLEEGLRLAESCMAHDDHMLGRKKDDALDRIRAMLAGGKPPKEDALRGRVTIGHPYDGEPPKEE